MTITAESELDTLFDVPSTAVSSFADDGFVKIPGVLSPPTLAAYEPEISTKLVELNTQHLPLAERDTYGRAFLQVTNLWQHSRQVERLVRSRRLAGIAAALLDVESVRLYHDQALYKEPGGGLTPWHADQYYWPLSSDRSITVWIPLQETPAELGPLEFAAGSHRFEFGRDLPISDQSEARMQIALQEQGFPIVTAPYELGEVSFHGGWTFHRAGSNVSDRPRRVMTIIYIDAAITVAPPANANQEADLAHWLASTPVGHPPDGPLTPVLYP